MNSRSESIRDAFQNHNVQAVVRQRHDWCWLHAVATLIVRELKKRLRLQAAEWIMEQKNRVQDFNEEMAEIEVRDSEVVYDKIFKQIITYAESRGEIMIWIEKLGKVFF